MATPECDRVSNAILADDARALGVFEPHLATCRLCRALLASHAAALRLQVVSRPAMAAVDLSAVARGARWQAFLRLSTAGALTALVLAGGWLLLVGPPRPAARVGDLEDLVAQVEGYTRLDIDTDDPAYESFGPVTRWVAPPPESDLDPLAPHRPTSTLYSPELE